MNTSWRAVQRAASILILAAVCGCSTTTPPETDASPDAALAAAVSKAFIKRSSSPHPTMPERRHKKTGVQLTPAQARVAACTLPNGSWMCKNETKPKTFMAAGNGAGTPITPASWNVPAWFFDPQNVSGTASDNNSCTTSGAACRTWGEIYVHRLGGPNADLNVCPVVVTELGSQTTATDLVSIVLDPDSCPFQFNGTRTQVTTATIGTFTVRNRAAGTPNTITASGQVGAYWTPFVGDLVHDTTANAWFWLDADLGSATARITEPMSEVSTLASTIPPPYVLIANGDALTLYTNSLLNLDAFYGTGLTLYNIALADELVVKGDSSIELWESNTLPTQVTFSLFSATLGSIVSYNSRVTPSTTGSGQFIGGAIVPYLPFQFAINIGGQFPFGLRIDGDALLDPPTPDNANALRPNGQVYMARAGLLGVLQTNGASAQVGHSIEQITSLYGVDSELWGPGQLQVTAGETYAFDTVTATASILLTGANYSNVPLTFEYASQTTGFPWVTASHSFGPAVALTAANIDVYLGLNWPQTGSRFWFRP